MNHPLHETQGKRRPVIGVDWRPNQEAFTYDSTFRTLEALGIDYVRLKQFRSASFDYDGGGQLLEGVSDCGALSHAAAQLLRQSSWQASDVEEELQGISAVIFTGGEDVSPSLYAKPQEWHGIEAERDYSAERDVSDYVLMGYCLEHDIPILCICRGMQVLSVLSGAEVAQDIGTWLAGQGVAYHHAHKQLPDKDGQRDFAPNDVWVEPGAQLYDIMGRSLLKGCPCWHHQAVIGIEGTDLMVSARTTTDGVQMIEGVERTDKTFAVGVQFHPEVAVQKILDKVENRNDYMDYQSATALFRRLETEGSAPPNRHHCQRER